MLDELLDIGRLGGAVAPPVVRDGDVGVVQKHLWMMVLVVVKCEWLPMMVSGGRRRARQGLARVCTE